MSSSSVARVAAAVLTLLSYAGVVLLPAFLLWLVWRELAPLVLIFETAGTVQR